MDARPWRARSRPGEAAASGSPAPRAGDVVSAYVGEQASRLKALDAAVRRDEPDGVHQMRVTTRRLRAALQAFPMVLPKATTRRAGRASVARPGAGRRPRRRGARTALPGRPGAPAGGAGDRPGQGAGHRALRPPAGGGAGGAQQGAGLAALLRGSSTTSTACSITRPQTAAATAPASEILPQAVARAYRRTKRRMGRARRCAPAPPVTSPCTRPGRRPSAPATRPTPRAGVRQAGPAVRQADEGGPVGPRRPPGRGDRPHGRPRHRDAGAPGGRERVQLRPAQRARAPRRGGVPAAARSVWRERPPQGAAVARGPVKPVGRPGAALAGERGRRGRRSR